jgi:integrase
VKLARVLEGGDQFPNKHTSLAELAQRFLVWLEEARLEAQTKKYYCNGWRLLKLTPVVNMRVDEVTGDWIDRLRFPNSAANTNCALRTLRRMLHKAEEWKLISHAPKVKLMKEHGRSIRLDEQIERRLLAASADCNWRKQTSDLFRDVVILMRDTGMRNQRELYRMRIENLDWENRLIFVPDSKTPEGRRLVPMSRRVFEILQERCGTGKDGWVFSSKRSKSGHIRSIDRLFRQARTKASLSRDLVLYCARHDYGTRILMRTGNLAAVMRTMGHQHPELEIVRAALDYQAHANSAATRV